MKHETCNCWGWEPPIETKTEAQTLTESLGNILSLERDITNINSLKNLSEETKSELVHGLAVQIESIKKAMITLIEKL